MVSFLSFCFIETKQEKKERKEREKKEKKEKKEKSRKREKDMTNDVGVENQESPSAKRKKKFGGFRLRGKKTKHSSLGSLKQEDRSGSEFFVSGSKVDRWTQR